MHYLNGVENILPPKVLTVYPLKDGGEATTHNHITAMETAPLCVLAK